MTATEPAPAAGDTAAGYGSSLFFQHQDLLAHSAISPDVAHERGYVSVDTKRRLEVAGFSPVQRRPPGLLIPIHDVTGDIALHEYRPDTPRVTDGGRTLKYEKPAGARNVLDVHPRVRGALNDPSIPLWVTEGARKVDAAVTAGLACVGLSGVYGWRSKDPTTGGKTALPCWESVALNGRLVVLCFDTDVLTKEPVRRALGRLATFLASRGAKPRVCVLPDLGDGVTGLDDYLAAGHTAADLEALVVERLADARERLAPPPQERPDPDPVALDDALGTFRRWMHLPDTDPLLAVAAAAVANRTGDASPVWLLVIGPPSAGKTEQIAGLAALPEAVMAATVTESALLSGTSARERAADATGGLLRQVGAHGLLVMKDFTSVLAQNADARNAALGALRECFDGSWSRPVGTDGGKLLTWSGKLGIVAGVTNAYDRHHAVISSLGDRFITVRLGDDDTDPDSQAEAVGLAALSHGADGEHTMRAELAGALSGVVAGADMTRTHRDLDRPERFELVRLARYAGTARTVVDRNPYTGDLYAVPAPEGPGRLTITYRQLLGGLEALGTDQATCWRIIRRLATDAAPALRAKVIAALIGEADYRRTSTVAVAAGIVTKTAHRVLDDLALIGLADHRKAGDATNAADEWAPSERLLTLWPSSGTEIYPPHPSPHLVVTDEDTQTDETPTGEGRSLSHDEIPLDHAATVDLFAREFGATIATDDRGGTQ